MDLQLTKLIKMLKLWLNKNSLDGDLHFYTIDEWRKRHEPYLNDSEFVIVTEGGLNFMLNYGDSEEFFPPLLVLRRWPVHGPPTTSSAQFAASEKHRQRRKMKNMNAEHYLDIYTTRKEMQEKGITNSPEQIKKIHKRLC